MNLFYLPKANLDVTSSKLCNGQLKQVVFSQYTEVIYGILLLQVAENDKAIGMSGGRMTGPFNKSLFR